MSSSDDERVGGLIASLFGLGLCIALVMVWRAQVYFDPLDLLARGWLLAARDIWVPLGNPATGGGYVPGGLTALLVGLPLEVWMDPRAPIIPILMCHVLAYAILDRLVGEALGSRARVVLAIVYWLNPWQLFNAGWLDNMSYGYLTGAVHVWACYRQRERASFVHSALLVSVVGLTAQLHLSATLLVIAAVLMWLRGYWKPHWGGVALGTAIALAAFVPYVLEALRHPEVLPASEDPFFFGLMKIWPPLKGVLYWLRYPSLAVTRYMLWFDFTPLVGARADAVLTPLAKGLGLVVGSATLLFPVLANLWLLRRIARLRRTPLERLSRRDWLRGYALWVLAATFISNVMSQAEVMWWHNLIALHAAVLPLLIWLDALLRTRWRRAVRRGLGVYLGLSVALLIALAFGSNQYRAQGRDVLNAMPLPDHPLLDDLGLADGPRSGEWFRKDGYFHRTYIAPELAPAQADRAR